MDKIIIRGLLANGVIGVYDWERQAPQRILINLVLYTDTFAVGSNDDINQGVDYSEVAEKVKKHAESSKRFTVEALAEDIANLCLAHPAVSRVQVRVEKPDAIDYTKSVGVQIERRE